jgi:uncharacterized membrane protein
MLVIVSGQVRAELILIVAAGRVLLAAYLSCGLSGSFRLGDPGLVAWAAVWAR